MKNPNDTHKYNAKSCIEAINNKLHKDGTYPMCKGQNVKINNSRFPHNFEWKNITQP